MKDAKGHGSNARPIPGHAFHAKTNDELRFIAKDAAEAGRNAQGMGDQRGVSKYADQVADAATVMGYRARGGKSDAPADALHSGTPKSDPAPTHDSMVASGVRPLYARVSSKNGSKLGEYGPHASREAAAAEAFSKHPNARSVSTSYQHGFDIRYHNK